MTITINTFADQSGPIALAELDTNFTNVVAAINQNTLDIAGVVASIGALTSTGQFTPTCAFSGVTTGITFAFRAAAYYKINKMCFFTIDLELSNKGAAVGNLEIGSLPFNDAGTFPTGGFGAAISMYAKNITFASGYLTGEMAGGSPAFFNVVRTISASNFAVITNAECTNATAVFATGYFVTT